MNVHDVTNLHGSRLEKGVLNSEAV